MEPKLYMTVKGTLLKNTIPTYKVRFIYFFHFIRIGEQSKSNSVIKNKDIRPLPNQKLFYSPFFFIHLSICRYVFELN